MDTSAAASVETGYLLPDHTDSFRYSWEPLLHRLRKHLLRRALSVAEAASQVIEVCPTEQGERSKSLYLQNQLERVIRVPVTSSYEQEMTRIRVSGVEHMATKAYQLRDAVLLDGVVFANGTRIPYVFAREKLARYRIEITISAAAIPSSVAGNHYFGHFIGDDACTALLARSYAPPCFVASDTPRTAHQERYLDIFGVPYQEARTCHFAELWVFDDVGMNHHRQARLQQLREKARALPGSRSGHGVFVRRRSGGKPRNMINEAELEDQLAQRGFEIIDPNQESVDSIIRKSRDAAVVVGVEGSALKHGLMTMQPGGLLLCLQPPERFTNIQKDFCDAMGMQYGLVVGHKHGDDFQVPIDDILHTIDLATD